MVIQAHPLTDSYNEALLGAVTEALADAESDSVICRLYEGHDPGPEELRQADVLVFVYPTWWGGLPAILLHWLQRRLGPALDTGAGSPVAGVRRVIAVTSHGSSKWVNLLQGEPGKRLLMDDVRRICSRGARSSWVCLYKLDRRSPEELEGFVERVRDRVRALVI